MDKTSDRNPSIFAETQPNVECIKCRICSNHCATSWCVDCSELICGICVDAHQRVKTTKNHSIIPKLNVVMTDVKCTNCTDGASATAWCTECYSFICELCINAHQRMKITSNHNIVSKEQFIVRLADAPNCDFIDTMQVPVAADVNLVENQNVVPGASGVQSTDFSKNVQSAESSSNVQSTELSGNIQSEIQLSAPGSKERFNLSTVLNDCPGGREIMKYYEAKQMLLPKHQKKLIKVILDKTFSIKNELTVRERKDIAQQISLTFMTEQSSHYMRSEKTFNGKRMVGKLEAAYHNRRKKFVKKRTRTDRLEDGNPDETGSLSVQLTDDIQKSIKNMEQNILDDDIAMMEWNNCFHFRMAKMSLYKDVNDIFDDWPYYTRINGFFFIDHDFQKTFGVSNALIHQWMNFCESNIQLIASMINDPIAKRSLLTMNTDQGTNEKSMIFCMALFHLPVNIPAAFDYGKNRWRPTVKMSKQSVFKRVYSKNSIAKAIKLRSVERSQRNIQEHPRIYGVGESLDEINCFFVALGNVLLEFNSFIGALDASFKCFKTLKIDFPKESSKFWNFIDAVFYKIEPINSDIQSIVDLLDFDFN